MVWTLALGLLLAQDSVVLGDAAEKVAAEKIIASADVVAAAAYRQGAQQFQQGQFAEAIATYRQALLALDTETAGNTVENTADNIAVTASLYSQLGHAYANQGDYLTAMAMLDAAQAHYKKAGLALGTAEVNIYRGFVQRRQGNYAEATSSLERAQMVLASSHRPESAALFPVRQWHTVLTGEALHNLAAVQAATGHLELAIALNHDALKVWQTLQPAPNYPLMQSFHRGRFAQ